MAELNTSKPSHGIRIRHRGRGAQVAIYFGKLIRMFVYQNDWKVLPMAAIIAGLVGMVIKPRFFVNMEGTLMSSFALVCVCVWNGCFNSIQVICRERDVIKREHRSGMHISSYVFSHMMYQALLCLAQTVVTLVVTIMVGVEYPFEGMITPLFLVDFAISMFLITYASDMLSLWVSALARTTTTAMTIMPFVLIFQLVFSGGMLELPEWTKPFNKFTISGPGLKVIAAQADTNHRPYATIAKMVSKMKNTEVGGSVTIGQALDLLTNTENTVVADLRAKELGGVITLGQIRDTLAKSATFDSFKQEHVLEDFTVEDALRGILTQDSLESVRSFSFGAEGGGTVGDLIQILLDADELKPMLEKKITRTTTVGDVLDAVNAAELMDKYANTEIGGTITVGEAVDFLANNPDVQAHRDTELSFKTTLGKVIDLVGEDKVKGFLEEKAAAASYNPDYECNVANVIDYWTALLGFVVVFALLAAITLEFIDKDKR